MARELGMRVLARECAEIAELIVAARAAEPAARVAGARDRAPRASVRLLGRARAAADHRRDRPAGDRGRRRSARARLQERSGRRRGRSGGAGRARLRGSAPALRAGRAARGGRERRDRALVPGAPARVGERSLCGGRARRARTSSWRRRIERAAAGAFAVSSLPHRGLCLTCPGRAGLCSWEETQTLRADPQRPACRGAARSQRTPEPRIFGLRLQSIESREPAGLQRLSTATLSGSASGARLPAPRWACPHWTARLCPGCTAPREHFHELRTPSSRQRPSDSTTPASSTTRAASGMVARLDNVPTHEVVARAITALENLEHRGATGADPCTGDGAGILMQMPDELLRAVVDFELPPAGRLRRADVLPADRRGGARAPGGAARADRARRGPAAARLARGADRPRADGRGRGRLPAGDPPAVRRRRRRAAHAEARRRTRSSASST